MAFDAKYDLHEDLGKGMFGVVKRCRDKETGQVFAAKIVRKTTKSKKEVQREISMMKLLKHERLAQIYESFETDRQMIIVMEFIPGKELFAKVTEDDSCLTEKTAVMYLKQLLLGIQHMHKKYIVHLDIKPENIICKPGDHNGTEDVKLIDFGLAREVRPGEEQSVLCGTPEFVAPEVLSYDPISIASDMWSIGVVTYVLLSGISPFLGDDDNETLQYVTAGEYDDEETLENVTEDARNFIADLLVVRPRDRMTVDECLCHRWITDGGAEKEIDTTNLRAFNAKRKWQKTLNAVKAVGRFAFLNKEKSKKPIVNGSEVPQLLKETPDQSIVVETKELVKSLSEESANNEYLHLPEISTFNHTEIDIDTNETLDSQVSTEISANESLNSDEIQLDSPSNDELSSNGPLNTEELSESGLSTPEVVHNNESSKNEEFEAEEPVVEENVPAAEIESK